MMSFLSFFLEPFLMSLFLLLFLSLLIISYILALVDGGKSAWSCGVNIDLGFILDASGSIQSHYDDYLAIIRKTVEHFPVAHYNSHIGVVSFSNDKTHVTGLTDHMTTEEFLKSLKTLPSPQGNSHIGSALKASYEKLFGTSEARQNVPKVMVVLSDGFKLDDTEEKTPAQVADEIESFGVKVI